MKQKPELIVALDVDTLEKAKDFITKLYPVVKYFKIGSQLFTAYGPEAIKMVGEKGAEVFLDLKFHDIPQTVFSGVVSGTGVSCGPVFISTKPSDIGEEIKNATIYPVFMMSVHTGGVDRKMLEAAVRGAKEKATELNIKPPLIVGVTVLTSDANSPDTLATVIERSRFAKDAGLDGVVCSVNEAAEVRSECGKDFIIVTPGIRPNNYKADDQRRIATAQEAIESGADFMVIGRPILEASDPLRLVKEILCQKN